MSLVAKPRPQSVVPSSRGIPFRRLPRLSTVAAQQTPQGPLAQAKLPSRFQGVAKRCGSDMVAAFIAATVVVLPCCAGRPAHAFDNSEAVLNKGATVFRNTCGTCHTGGMNIIEEEKTLEKDALIENLEGGFNYDAIVNQVVNGKGQMPAWKDSLSPEDIKAVAAYVYTQADTDAW